MSLAQVLPMPIPRREPTRLLELDGSPLVRALGRSPFRVRHNLVGHPLLEVPRILELTASLPARDVEYNAGDLPVGQDPRTTPRNGLSAVETIARIATCRSWLVLKHIEQDPEYAALLDRCLDEVAVAAPEATAGMTARHAFLFVSSPGAVTPYHMDPEYNFLVQVAGTKCMHLWDGSDRTIVSDEELERFLTGGHRNLTWRDELAGRERRFELTPGDALHVPVTFPHWVKNGPEVSVSLSITFRAPPSENRERVYKVNRALRRAGVTPAPVGESRVRDALKLGAYRAARRTKAAWRSLLR